MSFSAEKFLNTDSGPPGLGVYCYQSPDVRSLVLASGYLNNNTNAQNLAVGDVIHVIGSNGGYALEVKSISNSGDVVFYDHSGTSQGNTEKTLYIKGSDLIDGSIRFIIDPVDSSFRIEKRVVGIWADTRFVFGDDSGITTEHTIYTNSLDHILDNFFHPIYFDQN